MNKSVVFLAAIAAMTMASCSNDELGGPLETGANAISFRTVMDNSLSRANSITATTLESFKVHCFEPGNGLYGKPYFTVDVKKQSGAWVYDGEYVWKGTKNYHKFFAATELGSATFEQGVGSGGNYPVVKDFTLPVACIVDATGKVSGDGSFPDLCTAYYEGTAEDGQVNLNFQHQLARIQIKGKNSKTNRRVEVMGVWITGLPKQATWAYDTNYVTNDPEGKSKNEVHGSWTIADQKGGYYIRRQSGSDPLTLDGDYESLLPNGEAFMMFPTGNPTAEWELTPDAESSDNGGTRLCVFCRISTVGADGNISSVIVPSSGNKDKYGIVMIPVSFNLMAGRTYTYNIDFTNGSGQSVGGETPDAPVTGGASVNDDIDPDDSVGAGDFYEGGPITFNVSVADWVDSAVIPDIYLGGSTDNGETTD